MRPISVRPTNRIFHRYKAEEMSGPLPPVLFKVPSERYAVRLVADGEMLWSTLTWFGTEEDAARGDMFEGTRTYFPVNGLEVTRLERDGRLDNAKFTLSSHGFVSKAAQSNHIFIYSMTLDSALIIGDPSRRACVEIFDPQQFVRRVRDGVKKHRKGRETLIHDRVKYWLSDDPPAEVWALPDRLTMHKQKDYEPQSEYRLAFGTRADVFDFERIECFVVDSDVRWSRQILDPQCHRLKLHLGLLKTVVASSESGRRPCMLEGYTTGR